MPKNTTNRAQPPGGDSLRAKRTLRNFPVRTSLLAVSLCLTRKQCVIFLNIFFFAPIPKYISQFQNPVSAQTLFAMELALEKAV
jgi:hypothetical protein